MPADPAGLAAEWIAGSFSSAAQAAEDPENFLDIRLRAVPIWPERTDGRWIYLEQAAAGSPPYRQRIYQVTLAPDDSAQVMSRIYTFPDALSFAGASPERFASMSPDDLSLREGCAMWLTWDDARRVFTGSTRGDGCQSTLRGASYATSEATLGPESMVSWDRGFDNASEQVWGATAGGYRFDRVGR